MRWVCKQHGDACNAYAKGIAEELNQAKIKTIAQAKKFYGEANEGFVETVKLVRS